MATLTIGIDARKIRDFGIGRYVQGLLAALARISTDESYVLYTSDGRHEGLPSALRSALSPERFRIVRCDAGLYSVSASAASIMAPAVQVGFSSGHMISSTNW